MINIWQFCYFLSCSFFENCVPNNLTIYFSLNNLILALIYWLFLKFIFKYFYLLEFYPEFISSRFFSVLFGLYFFICFIFFWLVFLFFGEIYVPFNFFYLFLSLLFNNICFYLFVWIFNLFLRLHKLEYFLLQYISLDDDFIYLNFGLIIWPKKVYYINIRRI
jgi:hypothetical protein